MNQISNFITKHWKPLTVFVFIVNSYASTENKLSNLAQAQVETRSMVDAVQSEQKRQTEYIAEKITAIEVLANRIDERTRYEQRVRKQKDSEKDQ